MVKAPGLVLFVGNNLLLEFTFVAPDPILFFQILKKPTPFLFSLSLQLMNICFNHLYYTSMYTLVPQKFSLPAKSCSPYINSQGYLLKLLLYSRHWGNTMICSFCPLPTRYQARTTNTHTESCNSNARNEYAIVGHLSSHPCLAKLFYWVVILWPQLCFNLPSNFLPWNSFIQITKSSNVFRTLIHHFAVKFIEYFKVIRHFLIHCIIWSSLKTTKES